MANFDDHFDALILKEGGYVLSDHPHDRGGKTFAGISERAHPDWKGWKLLDEGAMDVELKPEVYALYKAQYWDPLRLSELNSSETAEVLLSCCVLSGAGTAAALAQASAQVEIDRVIGSKTLRAINEMSPREFCAIFSLARIARFRAVARKYPEQKVNLVGWINRVLNELAEMEIV